LRKNLASFIDDALSKSSSHSIETYQSAIQEALDREDEIANQRNWKDGSTLALVLIDVQQKILVEADLGDSHMVFAEHTRRNKKEENKLNKLDHSLRAHHLAKGKNEWSVRRLSVPHNPDNPAEKKRIEDAGGEVKYDTGTARVGKFALSAISCPKKIVRRVISGLTSLTRCSCNDPCYWRYRAEATESQQPCCS
jgi:serine/threonine protein phosphatase PrpC